MTDACVFRRLTNLLGAFAVAAAERIHVATEEATGRPGSDTAALVILTTVLGGTSQEDLAKVLGLTQSGSVRLVNRLVGHGLLERRPGPDGRTRAIVATAAGAQAARSALDARRAASAAILDPLDETEQEQLTALLEKILGGLTGNRAGALRICRLCDPDSCGHSDGRCPVTRAANDAQAATHRS